MLQPFTEVNYPAVMENNSVASLPPINGGGSPSGGAGGGGGGNTYSTQTLGAVSGTAATECSNAGGHGRGPGIGLLRSPRKSKSPRKLFEAPARIDARRVKR